MTRLVSFVLLGCVSCGGALMSKASPVEIRYFSPESVAVELTDAPLSNDARKLRLGRVTSSASLRSRIVRRESPYELAMYETMRWTDNPEVYVRRALAHTLFEGGAFEQTLTGNVPTLDVEVTSFEEVGSDQKRGGRVELRYELRDDSKVLASGTVFSEHAARTNREMGPVVAAIGQAMVDAITDLARRISVRLP